MGTIGASDKQNIALNRQPMIRAIIAGLRIAERVRDEEVFLITAPGLLTTWLSAKVNSGIEG